MRLLSQKQAPDESLRDYANSIRSLAAAAFPSDSMEAQNQAISAFIGGLTNKTTAAVLLGNPPADIATAVELADKLDYPTLLEAAFFGKPRGQPPRLHPPQGIPGQSDRLILNERETTPNAVLR